AETPDVVEQLAAGEVSFDRAKQLSRLPSEARAGHEGYDISGLRRLVADHRRLTRNRERITGNGFVHFGHSDELATTFWGELPGLDARIMEKAVDQRADEIVPGDQRLAVAERRALALVAICQDSLYQGGSGEESPPVDVAVIVDSRTAAETSGERGVSVLAGPRLGPGALEEILCNGNVDLIGLAEHKPLDLGRRSRTVGRKLRRHVLHRDGGCTVEGCPFSYRLQVHHVIPWSHGGKTDADNLITLCWFHHHVSIHREGLQIIRLGVSRVRLKRPR
ncbi:MAG: HNH endonuclease signature motif containing protein, partial [Acidimicrobiia bacterium]